MRSPSLIFAALAAAAAPVAADPIEHPSQLDPAPADPSLGVEIIAAAGEIDPVALRAAIGDDLGVPISDSTAFAPARGRLTIELDHGEARIVYQPAAGTLVERTVALPHELADRIELLEYIATNLVRDQTADVLASLPQRPRIVIPPPVREPARREPAPVVRKLPATLGFVPPLSIDRAAGEHVEVGFGLHALVGVTDASTIASISGLVDVQRDRAYGAQIGGLATIARRATAVQVGGLVAGTAQDVTGMQIGGVAAASGHDATGMQIGGVAAVAKNRMHGMQIAGIASVAHRVRGAQISGVASVGEYVDGAQIGLVNVARKMRGLQVGLINISEDGDDAYPIGLINYSKNGRLAVEGTVDSTRMSSIALRHGTKHVHNVWGLSWSPDHDHLLPGVGLGIHANVTSGIGFDLDAMNWWTNVWNGELGQLNQLRASVAVPVGNVEVFGGAAANVYISDEMDESAAFHPVMERRYQSDGGTQVVTWPSVFAGVRLKAR